MLKIIILSLFYTLTISEVKSQILTETLKINDLVSYNIINDSNATLINDKDTLKLNHSFVDYKLIDINNDGNNEVIIKYATINGYYYKLLKYNSQLMKIEKVNGIEKVGSFKPIPNTKYYISVKENGCSDLNWQSFLFTIVNNNVNVIAYLDWKECNEKLDIKLYTKTKESKLKLVKTYLEPNLPIIDTTADSDILFFDNIPTDIYWQNFVKKYHSKSVIKKK